MRFDTSTMDRITEDQFIRFIDTTPNGETRTWVPIAAVEEGGAGIDYNPQIDRLKLIINQNATTNHSSNDKQMSVTYLAYKGDPCFTFVNAGRDQLNYKTHFLEVDIWDESDNQYSAKMSNATIGITSYHGDTIEFDVYTDGDPTKGKVTISNNTPAFTPEVSL